MHPELASKIEAEVEKLIKDDFKREVEYPTWLANIVPVKKKMCRFEYAYTSGI